MLIITSDGRGVQFDGLAWQNIDSRVISQPEILFNFTCVYRGTVIFSLIRLIVSVVAHTSALAKAPNVGPIAERNIPLVADHYQENVPIKLYYSRKSN